MARSHQDRTIFKVLCDSELATAKQFCSLIKTNSDTVYVAGSVAGKKRMLTIATMLEIHTELAVYGPSRSWRVNVRLNHRKIVATTLRLRA